MIEHCVELTFISARFSVSESEVFVDPKPSSVMIRIVRTVESVFFDRSKVGLNDVEPRRISWRPDRDDSLC